MNVVEITYRYGASEPESPRPADADAAQRRLDDGNRGFAALLDNLEDSHAPKRRVIPIDAQDLGLAGDGAPAHRPYAAILGCSDARVPIELIFGEGPNDLFVVRVAGNTLGGDVVASLKYAVDHLGDSLKLVVVLGHSGCGAVSAAVDVFLDPSGYVELASDHVMRNLLDSLLVTVHASAKAMATAFGPAVVHRPGYRAALIEVAVVANAALAAHTVQKHLGSHDPKRLRAVFGVYVLATRSIWAPHGTGGEDGLADPPAGRDAFVAFSRTVMRSARIAAMLDAAPTAGA